MNVNEVISSISKISYGMEVHPNDHVNMSQSTNDVFPSAIHLAAYLKIEKELLTALEILIQSFKDLRQRLPKLIKVARTHLQDATPITVDQEISGWQFALEKSLGQISSNLSQLSYLALGATAVGTGLNTYPEYPLAVAKKLSEITGLKLKTSPNKFFSLASKNELHLVHSTLNVLAMDLLKIGNDIRLLASGPRAGIGEYTIPSNDPGSSIISCSQSSY